MPPQLGVEIVPLEQVHDQVGLSEAGIDAEVVNPHDVGMAKAGGDLRLAQEAGGAPFLGAIVGRVEQLDRDLAPDGKLASTEDRRVATAPDELVELVAAVEDVANIEG